MANSAFTPTVQQAFQDASGTQSGLVNTTNQTFAGDKTFTSTSGQGSVSVVGYLSRGNLTLATAATDALNTSVGAINFQGGPSTAGGAEARVAGIFASATGSTATARGGSLFFSTRTDGVGGSLTERMRITESGRIGIGTSSPGVSLEIRAQTHIINTLSGDWSNSTLTIWHDSGNSPKIGFHAPSTATAGIFKYYGPNQRFECRDSGDANFISIVASAFTVGSDYRLKKDVKNLSTGLDTLLKLRPVSWNWNSQSGGGEGFLAHELAEYVPNAVFGAKDAVTEAGTPEYQTVDYSRLVPILTKAIQELKQELDEVKLKLNLLQSK